jgi:hypothetical protein
MKLIIFIACFLLLNSQETSERCTNCYYGITRNSEIEYLMVKTIFTNLLTQHWNVTMDSLSNLHKSSTNFLKTCDVNIDYVCIKQTIAKDYRHPSHLFKGAKTINESVRYEYEAGWFLNNKLIDVSKHENKKHENLCNNLGLKIYCVLFDYINSNGKLNVCKMLSISQDEIISQLIDYYIAQSFIKSCYGNLEMISRGIHKMLKYDCDHAYTMKSTYFSSKYLNLFRTCDAYSNVNEMIMNKLETNCSSAILNYRNKKNCVWYEAVCKYPLKCLKSMNWTET